MTTNLEIIRTFFNLTCHILVGIVLCIYVGYWGVSYHVWLGNIGIVLCCSEGLLLSCPVNYTKMFSDKVNKILHYSWFGVGTILSILALLIALTADRHGVVSAHGILAVIGMIPIIISFIFGCIMVFSKNGNNKLFKQIHVYCGLIGYVISMISLIPALTIRWLHDVFIIGIIAYTLVAPIEIIIHGRAGN